MGFENGIQAPNVPFYVSVKDDTFDCINFLLLNCLWPLGCLDEGVTLSLDRLDPGREKPGSGGRVPSSSLPGDVVVPCLFEARHGSSFTNTVPANYVDDLGASFKVSCKLEFILVVCLVNQCYLWIWISKYLHWIKDSKELLVLHMILCVTMLKWLKTFFFVQVLASSFPLLRIFRHYESSLSLMLSVTGL